MALRQIARATVGFLFLVAAGVAQDARAQNWDGAGLIRFGVFLQGAQNDYKITQTPVAGTGFNQTASPDGFGVGIAAGYDLRLGQFIVGAEADIAWDNSKARVSPATAGLGGVNYESYGVDYQGTVRGRLGFIVHPSVLLYGTVGMAFLGAEYKADGLATATTLSIVGSGNKKLATLTGLAVGGGVEYDAGWGILFGEYIHTDYDGFSFLGFNGNRYNVDASGDLWRLGLKFKVGHDFDHDYYKRTDTLK